MNINEWFPLGIALEEAFCNRENERNQLKTNIENCTHTIIIAPRRYGKTSLATQSALESKLILGKADFMIASDELSAANIILNAVASVLEQLLPLHKKTLQKLTQFIASLSPKLVFSTHNGASLELTPHKEKPIEAIIQALQGLDQLAIKERKKIIILFDEFQQLSILKNSHSVEAAIRQVAQITKASSYIFSGSNRHMLLQMFDDRSRPLFHLCDRIVLNRIKASYYGEFLNRVSKKRWRRILPAAVIEKILDFTQCHPYFINSLCRLLFSSNTLPTADIVSEQWEKLIEQEYTRVAYDISFLSANQRLMLVNIAKQPTSSPLSKNFIESARVSLSSAAQAFKVLQEKDFVYLDDNKIYRIADPVMAFVLEKI